LLLFNFMMFRFGVGGERLEADRRE
jgi:hypothetical protein